MFSAASHLSLLAKPHDIVVEVNRILVLPENKVHNYRIKHSVARALVSRYDPSDTKSPPDASVQFESALITDVSKFLRTRVFPTGRE